ncbi:MAG TPA: hypothetical protein VLH86_01310 [Patescibacteria group bacterium]|nr:hypothetical protein [Patescibacteria group bacterium]
MAETNINWSEQAAPTIPTGDVYFVPASDAIPTESDKGFAPKGLTRDVKSLEPGDFLLLDEPLGQIANDSGVVAHFNHVPGMSKGRENGRQGVVFGQLVIETDQEPFIMEEAAIKPFHSAQSAAHEAGAMTMANNLDGRRGRPLSFEPLGFYKYPDGQVGLITRFDGPVLTQDLLFWNPDRVPTDAEVSRAFSVAALSLGGMHRYGVAHRDAQAKNVGRDNRGFRLVDLADAERMTLANSHEYAAADLGVYLGSLLHPDEINGQIPERDYTEPVAQIFVPQYLRIAQGSGTLLPQAAHLSAAHINSLAQQ